LEKIKIFEAFRMMDMRDDDIDKLESLKPSVKHFLAGNSICINVLKAIFTQLFLK
jgi:hypothetical protein